MKVSIRILALILAILTLLPLAVGCKKKKDGGDDTVATTAPEGETGVPSSLPAKDWGGKVVKIIGKDGGALPQFTNFEIAADEGTDNVVAQAVYNRNELLRTKYNFTISQKLFDAPESEMSRLYGANEHVYDIVMYQTYHAVRAAENGYLADLNELEYIDMDHPSWNSYANEQLTFGDKLFYTVNDYTLLDKHRTYCLFYNRQMARDKHLVAEDGYLEDMVDSGTWTIDEMTKMAVAVKADTGTSAGSVDIGDTFGVGSDSLYSMAAFLFGTGFRYSKMNDDGVPSLIAKNQGEPRVSKVIALWEQEDVVASVEDFQPLDWESTSGIFCDNRSLFLIGFPSSFDTSIGKNCEFEFGVLPYPKYNEKQKKYYTMTNPRGSMVSVPFTSDKDSVGFFVQALAEEATETSLKAYVDTKCMLQNAYDERCAKMLQLIFDTAVYDIVQVCDFGEFDTMIGEMATARKNYYTRYYDKYSKNAGYEMEKLLDKYAGL